MAKIQVYGQRTSASGSLGAGPVARAVQLDSGARYLEKGAQALGQAAKSMEAKQEEDAAAWTSEALSKARREWTNQLIERQQSAAPGAPEFTPSLMKDFDQYTSQALQNAPSATAKKFMQERLRSFGDDLYSKAVGFEAGAKISHRLNTVEQSIEDVRLTVESDPEQYREALAEQVAIIDALQVNPETKANLKDNAIQSVSVAAVQGSINQDAQATLDALKAKPGESGNLAIEALTLDSRQKLRAQAESILRQGEAARNAAEVRARSLITDARSRMEAGYALPESEMGAIEGALEIAGDEELANDWNQLRGMQDFVGQFQKLAPSQMRSVIDESLAPQAQTEGASQAEFMRLKAAESALNRLNTVTKQGEGLSYAVQTGIVSEIGDISTEEGRQLRAAVTGSLDARFGIPQKPLLPEEVAEITSSMREMGAPERLSLGMDLARSMGGKGFDALEQVGGNDGVFTAAVGLAIAAPAHQQAALDILAGQQMLTEDKGLAPQKVEVDLELSEYMPAFKNMPEQGAQARSAAIAHYVRVSAWDDSWTLQDSFNAVLGGGVSEINGGQFVLPPSVDPDDFEDALSNMTEADFSEYSLNGAPLYGDGTMANAEDIADDGILESVGNGQYIVRMPNGYLVDNSGEFYILAMDAERVNKALR